MTARRYEFDRTIRRCVVVLGLSGFLAGGFLAGCSGCEDKSPANAPSVATIKPLEGMKYYVGGPVMKFDKYGRMRLGGFNGEISSPTSRGLLLGFKKNDDGTFDYSTWLNGAIISESKGFLDADGLLWYTERISYDANGDMTVRQKFQYDDEKKIMTSTLENLDPKSGAVVRTTTQEIPYVLSEAEKQAMFDEEGQDEPAPAN